MLEKIGHKKKVVLSKHYLFLTKYKPSMNGIFFFKTIIAPLPVLIFY